MNAYRFTLGRQVDSSANLVTNGTFTGSLTGWSTPGISLWSYSSNEARVAAPSGGSDRYEGFSIKQVDIVNPGTYYYLSYKLRAQTATRARVTPSIGGVYFDPVNGYDENTSTSYATYTHENILCHHGNDLLFFQGNNNNGSGTYYDGSAAIDDVVLYPYIWNDPLEYEPVGWDTAKITKKRDESLNGLIINYISDLTFIQDGYDYLYAKYLSDGYCGEVPVKIEKYDRLAGGYVPFYEGYIYISGCEFNTSTKQVKVSISDSNSSQIFVRGKNVKVNIMQETYLGATATPPDSSTPTNDFPNPAPNPTIVIYENNAANSYATPASQHTAFRVYLLLKKLVMLSTGSKLDFDSDYFGSSSGVYAVDNLYGLCMSLGQQMKTTVLGDGVTIQISLNELFTELNKVSNLSFSIDNTTAIPTVKIEPKVSYLNSTPVLTLERVNNLKVESDKTNIVRTINAGYQYIDTTATGTGLNDPKGSQYNTNNLCADKELNLVCNYIQSSDVLRSLAAGTITGNKYDKIFCLIETDGTLDSSFYPAQPTLWGYRTVNSGSGTYDLNPNISEADNLQRHVETLQSSFLKPTIAGKETITKSNDALTDIYSFEYPITKDQFDLLVQAYNTVEFNTDGTGATTKEGYLLEANFDINTGITDFKLLA